MVEATWNPGVLWAFGSRFSTATPIRGFSYGGDPATAEYVYFIGSGQLRGYLGLNSMSDEPLNTGLLYMARVRATQQDVERGNFEYYVSGTGDGIVEWSSSFEDAAPLPSYALAFSSFGVGSIMKHGDLWYMAVTILGDWARGPLSGMRVLISEDGFLWKDDAFVGGWDEYIPLVDVHYVEYSDIQEDCNRLSPGYSCLSMPLVYGHYWVPAAVFPGETSRVAYLFSVWNRYWNYFYDFWYVGDPRTGIAEEERFRNYNTKMYWYKIGG